MSTFKDFYNKIILEAKKESSLENTKGKKEKQEVNGEKGKKNIIQETDKIKQDLKENDNTSQDLLENESDSNEDKIETNKVEDLDNSLTIDFLNKFIEYTELNYLNTSFNDIVNNFKTVLGKNDKDAIDILNMHQEERKERLNELKSELKELRKQMQDETEKAKTKMDLISLLDKSIKND